MTTVRAKSLSPLFPTLRPGRRRGADGEAAVATDQRQRLRGAMIAGVARFGYPSITIDDVCALAGVSTRDFYNHFHSKVDCFLEALDEVAERFCDRVFTVITAEPGVEGRANATITVVVDKIVTEPDATAVVLIDSLTVGEPAVDPNRRVQLRLEEIARRGLTGERGTVSPTSVRGIVFGLRRVTQLTIVSGDVARLRASRPELVKWMVGFAGHEVTEPPLAGLRRRDAVKEEEPGWAESPNSLDSMRRLTRGERVLRAVAQLAVERGYGRVTVPRISALAGTSNQALYKYFGSKEGALYAAFDLLAGRLLERVAAACADRPEGPERIAEALAELMRQIDENPILAGLAYHQLPAVGRDGLARLDRFLSSLGEIFFPERGDRPGERLIVDAAVGGLWGTVLSAELPDPQSEPRDLYRELFNFLLTTSRLLAMGRAG